MSRRKVLRRVAMMVLVLSALMGTGAAAEDGKDGKTIGFLPDPTVDGLPASAYRPVFLAGECKVKPPFNPVSPVPGVPLPGLPNPLEPVLPSVDSPKWLCPSEAAKSASENLFSGALIMANVAVASFTSAVDWLVGLEIAEFLAGPVVDVQDALGNRVVGPFGLDEVFLFGGACVFGFYLLTFRIRRGLSEVLIISLVLGLGGALLSSPEANYRKVAGLGSDVAAMGLGIASEDDTPTTKPMAGLRLQLIARGWETQNFGTILPEKCRAAAHKALKDGENAIQAVGKAGCEKEADYATNANGWRVASMFALTALIVAMVWSMGRFMLWIVGGSFGIAVGFMLLPVTLVAMVFKPARRFCVGLVAPIATALLAMAMGGLLLALTSVTVLALLAAKSSVPLVPLAMATMASVAAAKYMPRLMSRTRHVGRATVAKVALGSAISGSIAARTVSHANRTQSVAARARHAVGTVKSVATAPTAAAKAAKTGATKAKQVGQKAMGATAATGHAVTAAAQHAYRAGGTAPAPPLRLSKARAQAAAAAKAQQAKKPARPKAKKPPQYATAPASRPRPARAVRSARARRP